MRPTIVIDREYGSGGREVARILSENLGVRFFDGELLAEASSRYGIDLGIMKEYDEKKTGSMLYNIVMIANSLNNPEEIDMPFKIYDALARVMKQLVLESPCIFLGRCADEVLKDTVPLIRVFIYSDDQEQKMKRISDIDGITKHFAADAMRKKDAQRRNYYHYFTEREWGDRKNYDLCINTSKISYERTANIIADLYESMKTE